MARRHKNAMEYWADVGPRLGAYIAGRRDAAMEDCVLHALAVFSFVQEHLPAEATRHQELLKQTGILIVLAQDALRGLYGAQRELSPVACACLTRNILETRCNLLFIYKSDDPARWADRFHRYSGVEKLLHEYHRPEGGLSMLSQAERADILARCPEWLATNGSVKISHWTAEKAWKSLKNLAAKVGLKSEYHQLYGIGSKFMHGSPLLVNLYGVGGSIGAVSNAAICSQLSAMAITYCMSLLEETVAFYGAPDFEDDRLAFQLKWIACYRTMYGVDPPQPGGATPGTSESGKP